YIPPPYLWAKLWTTNVLISVGELLSRLNMPPPNLSAVFPHRMTRSISGLEASLYIPPPRFSELRLGFPFWALLSRISTSVILGWLAALYMPPPLMAVLLRMTTRSNWGLLFSLYMPPPLLWPHLLSILTSRNTGLLYLF